MKNIFFLLFVTLICPMIFGQEGLPIYSDYLTDNYYLIHPSMAGASQCSQIRVTGRRNWVGDENTPALLTAAFNGRINDKSAIGATVFSDRNGFYSQTGGYATYAHHLMFSRSELDLNMLSFGLSAGFLTYRLDESSFASNGDPLISGGSISTTEFNIDIGVSYHLYNLYVHATLKNALENSGIDNELRIASNLRNLLVSVGYVFQRGRKPWSFEPSLLFSRRFGVDQTQVDFNMKAYYETDFGRVWGGLSYRTSLDSFEVVNGTSVESQNYSTISPFLGFNMNKFLVAYTYSYQNNSIVFNDSGFHQITLGINFACRPKRYACFCPAVN